jgi:hypothetical protein
MRSLVQFVVLGLTFGAIALGLGFILWGEDALIQGGTAFGLTFVPAVATLAWAVFSYRTSPEMQLMATMGGSGVRMMISLGGGFLLKQSQPHIYDVSFLFWLLVFYLTFLATEIVVVLRQQPKPEQPEAGRTDDRTGVIV